MASLITLAVLAVLAAIYWLINRARMKKPTKDAPYIYSMKERPAAKITVNLSDCKLVTRSEYHDPEPRRRERYDALLGMGGDPASKRIMTAASVLKYKTEYKGKPVTLMSQAIFENEIAIKMKMFDQKTTTIKIFEDEFGVIDSCEFDLSFLNKQSPV